MVLQPILYASGPSPSWKDVRDKPSFAVSVRPVAALSDPILGHVATEWPSPAFMLRRGSHRRSAAVGSKTFRLLVLGPAIFQSKQLPRTFCITSEAAAGLRQTSTPVSPPATRETMAPAMSASSVRAGCGLRAAGDRRCYSVPSSGGPSYATQASLSLCSVVVSVVVYGAAQRAPIIAPPAEKIVMPC
jgi:hypothetical protein